MFEYLVIFSFGVFKYIKYIIQIHHLTDEKQKQVRCRKIKENRMRRSGSGCRLSDSPDSFNPSANNSDHSNPSEGPPAPITHVIASNIDLQRLEKLEERDRIMLNEVKLVSSFM